MAAYVLSLLGAGDLIVGTRRVEGELLLGRELIAEMGGSADVGVSRRHGRLRLAQGRPQLEDLGSRNGTFVNGHRLQGKGWLQTGDLIELGVHRLRLGHEDEASPELGHMLFAQATAAVTGGSASARLRWVYELTRLVEETQGAAAMAKKLKGALEGTLGCEVVVQLGGIEKPILGFEARALSERVLERSEVLRDVEDAQLRRLALPIGAGPAPLGVIVLRADSGLKEEDVQLTATAGALTAGAMRRAERARYWVETPGVELIGNSVALERAKKRIDTVAPHADLSVLLVGETGTGKELFAQRLHAGSARSGPFVPVNVAALPSELLESELFGHIKGAFTGATAARVRFVERAHGGTLFLDEIGEMPPAVQAKLLRVLQERTIYRLGESKPISVDVRLVAATNADLAAKMKAKEFREDLYYRIADQQTRIPPLRERGQDIERLVRHFIAKSRGRTKIEVQEIEDEALECLRSYGWPGNVRQLEGTIRLAVIHAASEGATTIGVEHLDERVQQGPAVTGALPLAQELANAERAIVVKALRACRGNKRAAARAVGMSINTLRARMERYDIKAQEIQD